jgi:penicillin-binding protein 2
MGIIAVVFAALIARLWHLQVIAGEDYRRQVDLALRDDKPLPPATRGSILDRRGEFLAVDKLCHELCLDYRFMTNDEQWVSGRRRQIAEAEKVSMKLAERIYADRAENTWRLACRFGRVSREQLDRTVRRIVRRVEAVREIVGTDVIEQRQAHPVVTNLDDAAAGELKSRLGEMVGATVRSRYIRYYPHGWLACHVIGTVGQVSAEQQARLNLPGDGAEPLRRVRNNYLGGDLIGKSGVERMCESVLRSRRGYCRRKRCREGFRILEEFRPQRGGDVRLTIDHKLQRSLTELFVRQTARRNLLTAARRPNEPSSGAIVVLSVPEGEVLAMVSMPVFDLNRYHSDFESLIADKVALPLLNRAVARMYPPGSTIKPLTALAGLAEKAITLQRSFHCDGMLRVGRQSYLHCWTHWLKMPGHGSVNVVEGLKHSCNIFFYNVGFRLGLEKLSRWLMRVGFANKPGTGLPEEVTGAVPTTAWLEKNKPGYRPVPVDAMIVAIGQGFVDATPLQVANAMAGIARGGEFRAPLLIREGFSLQERCVRGLGLDPACLRAVVTGMYRVVNEPGGTAYKAFHSPGVRPLDVDVHGKTGTATVPPADLDGNGRIDSYEKQRGKMAWFAGFALLREGPHQPIGRRRGIAFAVVVEYIKGGGSRDAAPIAREAIRIWREIDRTN